MTFATQAIKQNLNEKPKTSSNQVLDNLIVADDVN
jgi:hypothetical protein